MDRIKSYIVNHQLISFFLLAYLFTWILWIIFAPLAYSGGRAYHAPWLIIHLSVPLTIYGVFGPAIAAIIISFIVNPGKIQRRTLRFWYVFIIGLIVIGLLYRHNRQQLHNINLYSVLICLITAAPAAFVISSIFSRVSGIKSLLQTLITPKGPILAYIVALFLLPVMRVTGILINLILGREIPQPEQSGDGFELIGMIMFFIAYSIIHNIFGEEIGWRGFALPRFQSRFNPLISTSILGVLWLAWHLPLHYAEYGTNILDFVYPFYINIFFWGFIITWIYNWSKGSILAVGLMHVSYSQVYDFLPYTESWDFLMIAVGIFVIIGQRMWKKLPDNSPSVYRNAAPDWRAMT
ncbi:MAG: CPBP family intramembrane metalloprotease [bacterium]|nr:MAG: CPBP family intramembrane metalloprotease [bacterium]